MKLFILVFSLAAMLSCAHNGARDINSTLASYEHQNHSQMKAQIKELLDRQTNLSEEKKEKIEKILIASLEENKKLKVRESKLAQHFIQKSLSSEASFKELKKIRVSMKKNYEDKIVLFETAAKQLKEVIGIKKENQNFLIEASTMIR